MRTRKDGGLFDLDTLLVRCNKSNWRQLSYFFDEPVEENGEDSLANIAFEP